MRHDAAILFIALSASVILTNAFNQGDIQSTNDGYENFQKEAQQKIDNREWEIPQYSTRQVGNTFVIESRMDGIRKSEITVQVQGNVFVVAAAHIEPNERKFYHLTKNIPDIYDPLGDWNYAGGIFTIIFKMKGQRTSYINGNSHNMNIASVSQHTDSTNIHYDVPNPGKPDFNTGGDIGLRNPYGESPSRTSYNTGNYQQKSGSDLDHNVQRNWNASYESRQQQYYLDKYGRRIPIVASGSEYLEDTIEVKRNNFSYKSNVEKHTLHQSDFEYKDKNAHTNLGDITEYPDLKYKTTTESRSPSVYPNNKLKGAITTEHGAIVRPFYSKTTKTQQTYDPRYPNVHDTTDTEARPSLRGPNIILNKDIRVEQESRSHPLYSGANDPSPTIPLQSNEDTSAQLPYPSQDRQDNIFRTIQQRQGSGTGIVNGNPSTHSNWNGTFETKQRQYYLNEKGETIPVDRKERKTITVRENSFNHTIQKDTVQRHEGSEGQAGAEVYRYNERVSSDQYQYPNGDRYKI